MSDEDTKDLAKGVETVSSQPPPKKNPPRYVHRGGQFLI
jgi:hypothetical protein